MASGSSGFAGEMASAGLRLAWVRGEGPRPGIEAVGSFRRFGEARNMTAVSDKTMWVLDRYKKVLGDFH